MSDSSTNIPIWVQIILGSGFLAFIIGIWKQVTDARESQIKGLQANIESLQNQHRDQLNSLEKRHEDIVKTLQREVDSKNEEIENLKNFRQLLTKLREDINRGGITSEDSESLTRIESYLSNMQDSGKVIDRMRTVSKWVQYRKKKWADKATEAAAAQYDSLIPVEKAPSFRKDIEGYLLWLQESLYCGFYCRTEDYVQKPTIESPFPYRAAIQALKEAKDFGNLSALEVQDLQTYIDELARCVPC